MAILATQWQSDILALDWCNSENKEKKCHDKKAGQRRAWCVE